MQDTLTPRNKSCSPRPSLRQKTRRTALAAAARLVPWVTAAALARRFLTPKGHFTAGCDRPGGPAFDTLRRGRQTLLRFSPKPGRASGQRILIVAGLDGQLRQYQRLIGHLRDTGAVVDLLALPGHMDEAPGLCGFGAVVEAIGEVASETPPYDALIAHCLGCNGTLLALDQVLPARRLVFVSFPLDLANLVRVSGRQYGLRDRCLSHFVSRVSALGAPVPLDAPWRPIAARSPAPLLVVHARHDHAVPLSQVAGIGAAWPGAQLAVMDHGDHASVLSQHATINRISDFLQEPAAQTADPALPPQATGKFSATPPRG